MTVLNSKDADRLEVRRAVAPSDPVFYANLNRPDEDIEQRTKDLDRIFTPARGLRVRQVAIPSTSIEVEIGVYVQVDGVTVDRSNSDAVQTIAVPASGAGQRRVDLIYFNLTTGVAARVASPEFADSITWAFSLKPDLPAGVEAVPLALLYVDEFSAVYDRTVVTDIAGRIVDVRPAIGTLRPILADTTPVSDTSGGSAGTGVTVSREDHSHDTNVDGVVAEILTLATAAASGVATTYAKRDHAHSIVALTNPATLQPDGVAAVGVAVEVPRGDHVHPGNVDAVLPAIVNPSLAAIAGIATTYAKRDHRHAVEGVMEGRAIFGQVTAGGAIAKTGTADWTSSRVSLGLFRVTFNTPLSGTNYSVTANTYATTVPGSSMFVVKILDMLTTYVEFFVGNSGGSAADEAFNFQIMVV